ARRRTRAVEPHPVRRRSEPWKFGRSPCYLRRPRRRDRHGHPQPHGAALLHRHRLCRPDRNRRGQRRVLALLIDRPPRTPRPYAQEIMDGMESDIAPAQRLTERLLYEVKKVVVGQDYFLERVLVAILAQGHLLVEGVPGLAKTLTVKTLARTMHGTFKRIQFTPDLVPADLVGTRTYNQKTGEFATSLGPVFAHLLLADEINRAPAKVQSALLEVMQEYQVTIAGETWKVPEPFLVMATQNPIETEGTYPLPEAQVDRFMMKVLVDYPTEEEEFVIVERVTGPD